MFKIKTVVDETLSRKSSNNCEPIVRINVCQLYVYSMCKHMPTGLYKRYQFDEFLHRFKQKQNKTISFESMTMSIFQPVRSECEIESL